VATISASEQAGTFESVGLELPLGDDVGSAVVLLVVVGAGVGVALDDPPPGPRKNRNQNAIRSSRTAANTISRRRQYTPGCSGPTGLIRLTTQNATPPDPLAIPRRAAEPASVPWEAGPVPVATASQNASARPRRAIVRWYRTHGRSLPWRDASTTAWQVLVSEVMLGQTPVSRVAPAYLAWIERWPDPETTAAASPADILRMWGRLGYPRRALRLREAAIVITRDHHGTVPTTDDELRALPGVGEYTAAAVRAFAYGQRAVVLDTNVRRVLARLISGTERPPASLTNSERELATSLLPRSSKSAAEWSVAVMELGALVCTATKPVCSACPVRTDCVWRAADYPASTVAPRRQAWHGTDRQCRGRLMSVLRESSGAVPGALLREAWDDAAQRERCLDSLLDDALVAIVGDDEYALPSS